MSKKLHAYIMVIAVCVGVVLPAWAADANSDKLVKMVTYFPVPYASYNNLYIGRRLDVGLSDSDYEVELGDIHCNEGPALEADSFKFLNKGSILQIDGGLRSTNTVMFGRVLEDDSERGENAPLFANAVINATNLTIKDGAGTTTKLMLPDIIVSNTMESASVKLRATSDPESDLNAELPKCTGSRPDVYWKSLKFHGTSYTLLVCGEIEGCFGTAELKRKCLSTPSSTEQDGVARYTAGTWSVAKCECDCRTGYIYNASHWCEYVDWNAIAAGKKGYCESTDVGETLYNVTQFKAGSWNLAQAKCECNDYNYSLNANGRCAYTNWNKLKEKKEKQDACEAEGHSWSNDQCVCKEAGLYEQSTDGLSCKRCGAGLQERSVLIRYNNCVSKNSPWNCEAATCPARES